MSFTILQNHQQKSLLLETKQTKKKSLIINIVSRREITSEQGYYLLKNLGLNIMKSQLKQKVLRRLEIEEAENRNNENLKTICKEK